MKISREFLVGALVVVAIAVLYLGINFLKGINIFSRQQRYYAVFENVLGLQPSNSVILNGYKIGIVRNVEMNQNGDGTVVIEVVINDSQLKIPADTKLKIFDADLFGGKAVQLMLGDSNVYAESKDTLRSEIELGLSETLKQEIEPLKRKTSELFLSVDSILTSLNAVFKSDGNKDLGEIFGSLKTTLINVEQTTTKFNDIIDQNSGSLSSIFENVDHISASIAANDEKLTNAIKNFSTISDSLSKLRLATTLLKVDRAMDNVADLTEKINSGKGSIGKLMNTDSLHTQLVSASTSLDLLLNDMQAHPKRYVSFSLFGRRDDEQFSKKELLQMRDEIDKAIKDKEAKGEK